MSASSTIASSFWLCRSLTLGLFGLAGLLPVAVDAQTATFKNLQVLPKTITKPELKVIMKAQSKALGVDCDFCHTEPNMDADTEHKTTARVMMKMTAELNAKWIKGWPGAEKHPVTCNMCHQGKAEPQP